MTYINPFELLEISSNESNIIQEATNTISQQIKSSDKGYILYGTTKIDEELLHKVVAELNSTSLAEYHYFIRQRPRLLRFLKTGDNIFFAYYKEQKRFSSYAFKEFIGPYFIEAFNFAYLKAYQDRDIDMLERMLSIPALVLPEQQDQLFDSVKKELGLTCDTLKDFLFDISYSYKKWDTLDAKQFKSKALQGWDFRILNVLPDTFEELRSRLALILSGIAFKMMERFGEEQMHFFELIDTANSIRVSATVKAKLAKDYDTLYAIHKEKSAEGLWQLKQETQSILKRLRLLRKDVRREQWEPQATVNLAKSIVDVNQVNRLPNSFRLFKQQLVNELFFLSTDLWEVEEDINAYMAILQLTLQLDQPVLPFIPSEDQSLLLQSLKALRKHTRLKRTEEVIEVNANKLIDLLKELFSTEMCQILLQRDHYLAREKALADLLPLIHYARRREPVAVLNFLENIRALAQSDPNFLSRLNQTDDKILNDLQFPSPLVKEQKTYAAPAKRDPLERTTSWDLIQDQLQTLRAYLLEERSGPNRLVQLGIVGGLGSFILIAGTVVLPMLFKAEPIEPTYYKKYEHFVPFEQRPVAEYIKKKSLYVGNQLRNGSRPFSDCFGTELKAVTGNQVTINNPTDMEAVAVLYFADQPIVARHIYIRSKKKYTMRNLPNGNYKIRFYTGKDWNPLKPNFCGLHGAFDTNPQYFKLATREGLLECTGAARIQIDLDMNEVGAYHKRFPRISARGYFSGKNIDPNYTPTIK